jgi:hypothetical protein
MKINFLGSNGVQSDITNVPEETIASIFRAKVASS